MKIVVIGAGGHARTVVSILQCYPDDEVIYCIDKVVKSEGEEISGVLVKGFTILRKMTPAEADGAIVAIGDNSQREQYFSQLKNRGFNLINAIHPTAIVDKSTRLGKGVVIAAGAIICPCADIGDNTIVNTSVIIEHEVRLGENVHVAPGANIAGRVTVGRNSFVGLGSNVKDSVSIGRNVVVGVGSVVLEDVADNMVVAGVPARKIGERPVLDFDKPGARFQ